MFSWLQGWLGGRPSSPGEVERLRAEVEQLKAATGSLLGAGSAGGLFPEPVRLGDMREQERHYRGWVACAIKPIAQAIAGQPVHVARKVARRTPGTKAADVERAPGWVKQLTTALEEVPNHPLLAALDNPNELMTRWGMLFLTVAHLELTGCAYWMIVEGQGGPTQIIPLPPSWVTPRDDAEHFFASYEVRPSWTTDPFTVQGDDMVRFSYPNPSHPLRPASPLAAQGRAVAADEALQDAQRRAFENGLYPGAVVTVGRHPDVQGIPGQRPILTREQRAQIVSAIKQYYRGVIHHDEPLILDGLIEDVKAFAQSPREMDFLRSGSATKARIFQGFGVSPIIAGEIEDANRAQAIAAADHFNSYTVNPKIELLSQCLTGWLAPRWGADLVAWLEPCRVRDPDQERLDFDQLIKAKAVTINECRARIGLPPVPWGDVPVSPATGAASGTAPGDAADPLRHHALNGRH